VVPPSPTNNYQEEIHCNVNFKIKPNDHVGLLVATRIKIKPFFQLLRRGLSSKPAGISVLLLVHMGV
jgi:hypothetical protein